MHEGHPTNGTTPTTSDGVLTHGVVFERACEERVQRFTAGFSAACEAEGVQLDLLAIPEVMQLMTAVLGAVSGQVAEDAGRPRHEAFNEMAPYYTAVVMGHAPTPVQYEGLSENGRLLTTGRYDGLLRIESVKRLVIEVVGGMLGRLDHPLSECFRAGELLRDLVQRSGGEWK